MSTLARTDAALPAKPRLFAGLRHMMALHRQRRALLALDARMLHDIGLTRTQALAEATRAPWDAPRHWHGTGF